MIQLRLQRIARSRHALPQLSSSLLDHGLRHLQFTVREVNLCESTQDGGVKRILPHAGRRARFLERAVVATVIGMALLPLGDQRVPADEAASDPAVDELLPLGTVRSFSGEHVLHLLEHGARDERPVLALVRLAIPVDADQSDVEWVPQYIEYNVHGYLTSAAIAETADEHL